MKSSLYMRRLFFTLLIMMMTMVTANAQRQRVGDGTSGMTLTERQKGLAACACLMAQGDMNRLEPTVRMALKQGRNHQRTEGGFLATLCLYGVSTFAECTWSIE